jgi:hypothetical protein
MRDLFLWVTLGANDSFRVYQYWKYPEKDNDGSVFVVQDYPYTPWIRKEGNLLW